MPPALKESLEKGLTPLQFKDLALKVKYLEYGNQQFDPFFIKVGNLASFTLGHGMLMNDYANDSEFPAVRKVGLDLGMNVANKESFGFELLANLPVCIPERDAFGHHTVWAHIKLSVDQAATLAKISGLPDPKRLALLLAALYHDLGKATTTRWEFKRGRMTLTSVGHDVQSERAARRVLVRFKVQTWGGYPIGRVVPLLIRAHHRAGELWSNRAEVTKKAFNRLAAEVQGEIDLLILLDAADRAGRRTRLVRGLDRQACWLVRKFAELQVNRETIKPLIMGRDLLRLGVAPGPGMGRLLKRLYKIQLDNGFETKAEGLRKARALVEREKP